MPNWISTCGADHHGTVARRRATSAARTSCEARASRRSPEQAGWADDQHQHQNAEADDIRVGRSDIERGQRFDDAEKQAADEHINRIIQSADDCDRKRFAGQRRRRCTD